MKHVIGRNVYLLRKHRDLSTHAHGGTSTKAVGKTQQAANYQPSESPVNAHVNANADADADAYVNVSARSHLAAGTRIS